MNRSEAETSKIFIFMLEPGDAPHLHIHHDAGQIFYMKRRASVLCVVEDGSLQFQVKPGDVVRTPLHTFYSVLCDGREPIDYLSIDCFLDGQPEAEPTWESQIHLLFKQNGSDFNKVCPQEWRHL
jgi:hypothetical protein